MTMTPSEMRTIMINTAMEELEALDDEALALCPAAQEALMAIALRLRANGLSSRKTISLLQAMVLGFITDDA